MYRHIISSHVIAHCIRPYTRDLLPWLKVGHLYSISQVIVCCVFCFDQLNYTCLSHAARSETNKFISQNFKLKVWSHFELVVANLDFLIYLSLVSLPVSYICYSKSFDLLIHITHIWSANGNHGHTQFTTSYYISDVTHFLV